ncbi:MAG: hypothetical protein P0Y62_17940 [Candidatus Chryseobacterium colombiense]|nr:hypothetical protein [Chryseobacterium sp.]WEK69683.1 MAG: hypothetical protein P0Y62_17940 [Chryseobacterium sp.]
MQKNFYLIIILFCLVSCYTYQVKKPADATVDNKQDVKKSAALANTNSAQTKSSAPQSPQQAPVPINIQQKLAPNKNVKIDVYGKTYKVIVDRWERDSLIVHPVHSPKKILKFHKNQINPERIAEKRFSQPIADILTVIAYASIGVGIYLLVK